MRHKYEVQSVPLPFKKMFVLTIFIKFRRGPSIRRLNLLSTRRWQTLRQTQAETGKLQLHRTAATASSALPHYYHMSPVHLPVYRSSCTTVRNNIAIILHELTRTRTPNHARAVDLAGSPKG